jgi:hypothetical protein
VAFRVYFKAGGAYSNEHMGELLEALTVGGSSSSPHTTDGVWRHPDGGPGDCFSATGTTSPVVIGTGWATVASKVVYMDAPTQVAVPTPNSAARKDRIVLRYQWATQTADILLILGNEGGQDYPSYTTPAYQTDGTVWCIPLWKVDITTSGAITLTDERNFVKLAGYVVTGNIADNAVTNAKLRDSAALSVIGRASNSAGDPADIAATPGSGHVLRESGNTIGFGQVGTSGIADGAITSDKIASGAVGSSQIADNAIGSSKIASGAVGTDQIADGAVTIQKLAATGHGSGLNADMVDGQHASAFASASHNIISSHTVSGSAMQVVGLTGANTLGLLTPSSSPSGSAILCSDSSGGLTLKFLRVEGAGVQGAILARFLAPSLATGYVAQISFGSEISAYNYARFDFSKHVAGSPTNELAFSVDPSGRALIINGYNKVGINMTPTSGYESSCNIKLYVNGNLLVKDINGKAVAFRNVVTSSKYLEIILEAEGNINAGVNYWISRRDAKKDFQALHVDPERLLALRPLSFRYKASPERLAFGLVAEDVAEVLPELVAYDSENRPHHVQYELMSVLLLELVRKLKAELEALKKKVQA